MDIAFFPLISSIIALCGVLVSVSISFLLNKRQLKLEIEKIEMSLEQNYATTLIAKRLEFYPLIYELLSSISKKIRKITLNPNFGKFSIGDIQEFEIEYEKLNSKYGIVFSSFSSAKSKQLRIMLIEINLQNEFENSNFSIPIETLISLKDKISNLEFALKQDLGIYIVEFKDPRRKLQLSDYKDLFKHSVQVH